MCILVEFGFKEKSSIEMLKFIIPRGSQKENQALRGKLVIFGLPTCEISEEHPKGESQQLQML
jgi:hypothetical protein